MVGDFFVQSELRQENWDVRLTRISQETCDLIAATRKVIAQSREAIREADRILGNNLSNKQEGALPDTVSCGRINGKHRNAHHGSKTHGRRFARRHHHRH